MKRYEKGTDEELKEKLSGLQYKVTQQEGTERPFNNRYWDNHRAGIYVDVVSGEPLFSSVDKFDSGSGWPSFTKALEKANISQRLDNSLAMKRIEVRSRHADSHLGHWFEDGPTGSRYCINSAALRFIPVEDLEKDGYAEYLALFDEQRGSQPKERQTAILAGGCFWGMEKIIRVQPGVLDTVVGYTGGTVSDPNYPVVSKGRSGHAEAIRVEFDPTVISYEQLLDVFFRMHDPTTPNRQGNDVGSQYRSAIFVLDEEQRRIAESTFERVDSSGKWPKPLATEIVEGITFYPAEKYHQDYLQKHPGGYCSHYLRD